MPPLELLILVCRLLLLLSVEEKDPVGLNFWELKFDIGAVRLLLYVSARANAFLTADWVEVTPSVPTELVLPRELSDVGCDPKRFPIGEFLLDKASDEPRLAAAAESASFFLIF